MGIAHVEVKYSGAQQKTIFNNAIEVSELAVMVVPKPPAPPKPQKSALANAAAAVAAPEPDKTPLQLYNEAAGKIDLKLAGKHFNGKCLEKDDNENIKSVSCNAKFIALLDHFD